MYILYIFGNNSWNDTKLKNSTKILETHIGILETHIGILEIFDFQNSRKIAIWNSTKLWIQEIQQNYGFGEIIKKMHFLKLRYCRNSSIDFSIGSGSDLRTALVSIPWLDSSPTSDTCRINIFCWFFFSRIQQFDK